jgi:AmmeMemoRadiSam system protein B
MYETRDAFHAGSWYDADAALLNQQLQTYLDEAAAVGTAHKSQTHTNLRAVICPHAGIRYSGATAAYSYQAVRDELLTSNKIKRIVALHPSHHVYLNGCAVSGASNLQTPLGNLRVDAELRAQVLQQEGFSTMTKGTDEHEHSGEMQYVFLAKLLKDLSQLDTVPVLPIMIGALDSQQERDFGGRLANILGRSDVLTVVSSDFCHWGERFQFTSRSENDIPIYEFIQRLDRQGMDLIELQKPGAFADYIKETKNTICGRHAIAVWLHAITCATANTANENGRSNTVTVKFLRYAQSSQAQTMADSSVSYAAAVATATKEV